MTNIQTVPNFNIEEVHQENKVATPSQTENNNDDNLYYELDSDSLINVFDDLDNYHKNEDNE